MTVSKLTPLQTAREAWGDALPDWVEVLAIACTRTSQNKVATALECSGAAVSQVLRKIYAASTDRIEVRVRGVLMDGKVECPAFGEMPVQVCQDWRDKAGTSTLGSPMRNRMHRACNRCPRYLEAKE